MASQVVANAYQFMAPDTECQGGTARLKPSNNYSILEAPLAAVRIAQEALTRRRLAVEAGLFRIRDTCSANTSSKCRRIGF